MIRDSAGSLYGTTPQGGAHSVGTVFAFNSSGKRIRLYSFQPWNGNPNSALLRDSAGNLYGITGNGGAMNYGTLFRIDTSNKRTQLWSFGIGNTGGVNPIGALAMDSAGTLYGTTWLSYGGWGEVWKYDTVAGTETDLYNFIDGYPQNGPSPMGGVFMDSAGNFYGSTFWGGDLTCTNPNPTYSTGCGTVFMLTP